MTRALFIALSMVALATPAAARDSLGIYSGWGAFRDASPARCYAIAKPVRPRGSNGFVAIADWPDDGIRGQLHVRLSRTRNTRAAITLSIGERRFELIGGPRDAWAPDADTDAAIVGAIRSGRSMSVETVGVSGRAFADVYALQGAASAIDAAALGCFARNGAAPARW
ncbi:hypothetical protein KY084_10265 [Stakelama sp. CBK3Z-3]|uniref:Mlr4354 like protein n=1 Tax=Stakelama flava TaxID=2860338 RepID=A0ABS6XM43_9SPHN|nr:hypothetical protein [Stakelama flava]MBW4331255.1 hypothetical protein [Stakelama flava]